MVKGREDGQRRREGRGRGEWRRAQSGRDEEEESGEDKGHTVGAERASVVPSGSQS